MDKKIVLSVGLPITIRNSVEKMATFELNNDACVICRFHPENSVYLGDARPIKWCPSNLLLNLIYRIKKYRL